MDTIIIPRAANGENIIEVKRSNCFATFALVPVECVVIFSWHWEVREVKPW